MTRDQVEVRNELVVDILSITHHKYQEVGKEGLVVFVWAVVLVQEAGYKSLPINMQLTKLKGVIQDIT